MDESVGLNTLMKTVTPPQLVIEHRFTCPPGHLTIATLEKALRYKPEGRGFDSRGYRNFSLT
jgi:hypothetical protein